MADSGKTWEDLGDFARFVAKIESLHLFPWWIISVTCKFETQTDTEFISKGSKIGLTSVEIELEEFQATCEARVSSRHDKS